MQCMSVQFSINDNMQHIESTCKNLSALAVIANNAKKVKFELQQAKLIS